MLIEPCVRFHERYESLEFVSPSRHSIPCVSVRESQLIPNPFDVLSEHDLLPSIVELCRPTVCVISDVLGSLECATFLKKASESASPERVRRVTTNNSSLR